MSERNFDYMDENGAKDEVIRLDAQVRELEAENATLSAELAKAREACEQGKARCQNFLNGLLPACGPMTSATAVMISSIQNDFKEALGHDFEAEVKPLAAKGPTNE